MSPATRSELTSDSSPGAHFRKIRMADNTHPQANEIYTALFSDQ